MDKEAGKEKERIERRLIFILKLTNLLFSKIWLYLFLGIAYAVVMEGETEDMKVRGVFALPEYYEVDGVIIFIWILIAR